MLVVSVLKMHCFLGGCIGDVCKGCEANQEANFFKYIIIFEFFLVNYNYSLKCIQNNLVNYSYFGSYPRSCIQPLCKALKNVYASMT
jgi:hypothetical protein